MRSMRARIALIAGASTALVAIALAIVLGLVLRSSLTSEIEEAVIDQVQSYTNSVFFIDDIGIAGVSFDEETLAVVVTPDGTLLDANDGGVTGSEIADKLDLAGVGADEIVVGDLSLTSPDALDGERNLRFAMARLLLEDPPGAQPIHLVARSLEGVDSTIATVRNWVALAVPLLALFVAGLAWWLTGRALRPVDRLRQEVDEIEVDDLSLRVTTPGSADEIDRLAKTMNSMLARLDDASTRQRRFASDAAHELRTPLASMAAQLDVDQAHPDIADRDATAASMRREVSRLQGIVDDLLSLSRDPEASAAVSTLVDLDDLALEACSSLVVPEHLTVDQRGIAAAPTRGHAPDLRRVADNLVANAFRHAASRVAVTTTTIDGAAQLIVDDDGSGIATADRERVFERFVRLDDARSRDAGGAGLGLALVREIVERHGGTAQVVDSPLGGARFEVSLPST